VRVTIRTKLLIFAIVLALIPLGIAGRTLIRITEDELKNSVNEELSSGSAQLANDIDAMYENTWRAPLLLIRKAVDNPQLGIPEKVALLTNGTENIPDLISIQISAQGIEEPLLITNDQFTRKLRNAGLNPLKVLPVDTKPYEAIDLSENGTVGDLEYIPELDDWMISIILKLEQKIRGRQAILAARLDLERLRKTIQDHRLNRSGFITLIQPDGCQIFSQERKDLKDREVVQAALEMLGAQSRVNVVRPFKRPTGEQMLSAFGYPRNFDWAIIVEEDAKHAYQAIAIMTKNLILWVIIGFLVAAVTGIYGSQTLSRPIVAIGKVAQVVGTGDLSIRVERTVLKYRDEIGDLGRRMNEMIEGLWERFHLTKFVSEETVSAIRRGGDKGIKLGGERKKATVFFSDIRGFTAFSEKVEPEVVIEMLNTYLSVQANLVHKFHGDVDKYVGDELVAVFKGDDMVINAVCCAVEIQKELAVLNAKNPQWNIGIGIGINTGDMVMGAMGSEDRMDYTILGDNVNLGARLCANAGGGQNLLSENAFQYVKDLEWIKIEKLEPIKVKGKALPIQIYNVIGIAQLRSRL